jgi:hypothetical protein
MGRQRFTAESIVRKLREAEVDLSRGQTLAQVCRKIGVCEQTYHRWRRTIPILSIQIVKSGMLCPVTAMSTCQSTTCWGKR